MMRDETQSTVSPRADTDNNSRSNRRDCLRYILTTVNTESEIRQVGITTDECMVVTDSSVGKSRTLDTEQSEVVRHWRSTTAGKVGNNVSECVDQDYITVETRARRNPGVKGPEEDQKKTYQGTDNMLDHTVCPTCESVPHG